MTESILTVCFVLRIRSRIVIYSSNILGLQTCGKTLFGGCISIVGWAPYLVLFGAFSQIRKGWFLECEEPLFPSRFISFGKSVIKDCLILLHPQWRETFEDSRFCSSQFFTSMKEITFPLMLANVWTGLGWLLFCLICWVVLLGWCVTISLFIVVGCFAAWCGWL